MSHRGKSAKTTARLLFGLTDGRTMESPEEREHMAVVLGRSHDERVQRLVTDLLAPDPANKKSSLARIAERHGLNFHEISEEYRKLRVSEGYIKAAHKIPAVMEQVAQDALHRFEPCAHCEGEGKIDSKDGIVDCPTCAGKGQVFVQASAESIKLMFDTFGLTGKSGGLNVNLDLRKTDGAESLHDLAGSLSGIIEGERK